MTAHRQQDGDPGRIRTGVNRVRNSPRCPLRHRIELAATRGFEPLLLGSEPRVLAAERHGNGQPSRTRTGMVAFRRRAHSPFCHRLKMVDSTGFEPVAFSFGVRRAVRCATSRNGGGDRIRTRQCHGANVVSRHSDLTPGARPRSRTAHPALCRRPPSRLARRAKWCSWAESNCRIRVRSAESLSRGRSKSGAGYRSRTGLIPVWKTGAIPSRRNPRCLYLGVQLSKSDVAPASRFERARSVLETNLRPTHAGTVGVSDGIRTRVNSVTSCPLIPLEYAHHATLEPRLRIELSDRGYRPQSIPDHAAEGSAGLEPATSSLPRKRSASDLQAPTLEDSTGLEPAPSRLRGERTATRAPNPWRR